MIRRTEQDILEVITEFGPAIAYLALVGTVELGDTVLLNRTASLLGLGTGGYDFVIAVLNDDRPNDRQALGHIVKLRYTPSQIAVATLEELPELSSIWKRDLEGMPVVVCQLHSQVAHSAAEAAARGKRVVYIMTDTGCLIASFSQLLKELTKTAILHACITSGQAFGGDYETVTVHSALLAARHFLNADIVIVGQGPGNAGTGTKYGFGGIDQAGLLDIAAALGGKPIAVLRCSAADSRSRHRGVSHHSITALRLVRSTCTIPIPKGMICAEIDSRHSVVEMEDLSSSFDLLDRLGISVTTMGRRPDDDHIFFEAAAAAGKYASLVGEP